MPIAQIQMKLDFVDTNLSGGDGIDEGFMISGAIFKESVAEGNMVAELDFYGPVSDQNSIEGWMAINDATFEWADIHNSIIYLDHKVSNRPPVGTGNDNCCGNVTVSFVFADGRLFDTSTYLGNINLGNFWIGNNGHSEDTAIYLPDPGV